VLPVVCLHLVVPELIARTHNAFGSLLLYVAHHDEEFVEHSDLHVLSELSSHSPLSSTLVNS
jgi:hypothetical protein